MVNTTDFGKRIQKIMEYYALSASSFADMMGVGRSSISHILSGRNKPSLDFVMKITDAYPDATLNWLLYGEGSFPKSKNVITKPDSVINTPVENKPSTLPKSDPVTETKNVDQNLFSEIEDPTPIPNNIETEEIQSITKKIPAATISSDKEIHQIVFFYTDGTFDAFKK